MKLIDGLKLKGSPAEIPDCSRDDLPEFFTQMGYKVGVEIGVFRGEFSVKLCRTGLTLYAIDPWKLYPGYEDARGQAFLDALSEQAKRALSTFPNCTIIKKTSMEAVEHFENESLDFVYIDGHHGFRYIAEDLWEWTQKVKRGGVIAGHDYVCFKRANQFATNACHVSFAVEAFTKSIGIKNWYLLGRRWAKTGERRDHWRSWMFIRP